MLPSGKGKQEIRTSLSCTLTPLWWKHLQRFLYSCRCGSLLQGKTWSKTLPLNLACCPLFNPFSWICSIFSFLGWKLRKNTTRAAWRGTMATTSCLQWALWTREPICFLVTVPFFVSLSICYLGTGIVNAPSFDCTMCLFSKQKKKKKSYPYYLQLCYLTLCRVLSYESI